MCGLVWQTEWQKNGQHVHIVHNYNSVELVNV